MSQKELSHKELEKILGGAPVINLGADVIKVVNKLFAGTCSFIDGVNGKKYKGKC
ncbi:bacteriocin [Streptococcus thoraltensis]|uniref:bacteriocin n=1 Tax=Streptococcus thoraltensis TaxID=55085 RepID=UPI00037D088C|nr:bacteriocin [Streptococcus thoraltensis]MDY4760517.1 bacteriocin [Streptococcus thoraltensis]